MISNDWQVIDNLEYESTLSTTGNRTCYSLTKTSAEKIANAVGWEVVELSDYFETIELDANSIYDTSKIRGIRPISDSDEKEYDVVLIPVGSIYYGTSGSWKYASWSIQLSTGKITALRGDISGNEASVRLLRPTSQGCFCLYPITSYSNFIICDKFYNPKTGNTKWASANDTNKFIDLYTGLSFDHNSHSNTYYVDNADFGGYVALKKATVINSEGVYNARTLYRSYIDYSYSDKTIELGGIRYRALGRSGFGTSYYIPLAE